MTVTVWLLLLIPVAAILGYLCGGVTEAGKRADLEIENWKLISENAVIKSERDAAINNAYSVCTAMNVKPNQQTTDGNCNGR